MSQYSVLVRPSSPSPHRHAVPPHAGAHRVGLALYYPDSRPTVDWGRRGREEREGGEGEGEGGRRGRKEKEEGERGRKGRGRGKRERRKEEGETRKRDEAQDIA